MLLFPQTLEQIVTRQVASQSFSWIGVRRAEEGVPGQEDFNGLVDVQWFGPPECVQQYRTQDLYRYMNF